MAFIRVPFTSEATQLADVALQKLMDTWDGYEPNDGDMEVVQIETIAPMAQAAVEAAAEVPDAIFRGFGQALYGIAYLPGVRAFGEAKFTAIDDAGYNSIDPVEISLGGVAFTTDAPLIIPESSVEITLAITANVEGVIGNGLSGQADVVTSLPWLETVEVDALTTGGKDGETDTEYENRLSDLLQLSSTTLVTGRDFELMAVYQPGIARALAIVGQQRQVDVYVTDEFGQPCTTTAKDDLEAIYAEYRQVNTVYNVLDAQYQDIAIVYSVQAQPGYDPVAVKDQADQAVRSWLDPINWGRPTPATENAGVWQNENLVRYSELIRVLGISGVRYVNSATINGGTADVNMPDPVSLTHLTTLTGTVTGP